MSDINPLVGVPDGHVEANGETVVYEYDDKGEFVGWHKEPAAGFESEHFENVVPRGPEGWIIEPEEEI